MPEIIKDCEQGSESWHLLRAGSIGGTAINSVLSKGAGKMRRSLLYKLAAEILTGQPTANDNRWQYERGHEFEPQARALYEFDRDVEVEQVALIRGDVPRTHVSPDGLVGEGGGIEIKTMMPHVYIELLDTGKIDLAYKRQCQMFLWVSRRKWVDLIAFSPEMPADKRLWVQRQYPDRKAQDEIELGVEDFLADLDKLTEKLGVVA